jgi:prophage antirepressor-like protein
MGNHCRGVAKRYPISDSLGRTQEVRVLGEPDVLRLIVNCSLPAAQEFERLVFEEILPTIRKTGSYSVKPAVSVKPVEEACRLLPYMVKAARACGLDKNAAARPAETRPAAGGAAPVSRAQPHVRPKPRPDRGFLLAGPPV